MKTPKVRKFNKDPDRPARISQHLHDRINQITDARAAALGKKGFLSTETITELIVRHKSWPEIQEDIIGATKDELEVLW